MDTSTAIRLALELSHCVAAARRAGWLRPPGELAATISQIEQMAATALAEARKMTPIHPGPR